MSEWFSNLEDDVVGWGVLLVDQLEVLVLHAVDQVLLPEESHRHYEAPLDLGHLLTYLTASTASSSTLYASAPTAAAELQVLHLLQNVKVLSAHLRPNPSENDHHHPAPAGLLVNHHHPLLLLKLKRQQSHVSQVVLKEQSEYKVLVSLWSVLYEIQFSLKQV